MSRSTHFFSPPRLAASACAALVVSACAAPGLPNQNTGAGLEPTRTPAPASAAKAAPATIQAPAPAATSPSSLPAATQAGATAAPAAKASSGLPDCADLHPDLGVSTAPAPQPARPPGRIAFTTPDSNLAVINSDGAGRIDLTTDAIVDRAKKFFHGYQFPTWSNDGQSLAFVAVSADGQSNTVTQTLLTLQPSAKSAPVELYSTNQFNIPYIDWSPDSDTVAFLTIAQGAGAIQVVDKAGGQPAVLDTGASAYWHWRNDSTSMIAHLGGPSIAQGGNAHLSVIRALNKGDKGASTRVESLPGRFQSPQYSPNGAHMLYVLSVDAATDDLVLADEAAKPLCTVTHLENGAFFAWSPSGTQVALFDTLSPPQMPAALVLLDLATGKRVTVDRKGISFYWAPDGSKLALYSVVTDVPATQIGRAGGSGALFAPAAQGKLSAAMRIEVVDAASGDASLVADTVPTRDSIQYFQFFDQYSRALSPWSPNGAQLVFVSADASGGDDHVAVATLNPGGSAPSIKRIAAGEVAFWSPQ